ncbi:GT-D fold domain-containing glycosyltransferase [Enterococcus raffinosus]|uniref:GT-D fold domain-containing glycosyltransferase n=1 Tax=Enterococcus raffinosus TaxID=71452 RepID=UPI001C95D5EB|nr:GT-D fold domain-containing glycosyltransferase [Enterococcus raffinosus]QZO08495.1 GT-D fold domain-containing protein [Enterococcus raffinosus]
MIKKKKQKIINQFEKIFYFPRYEKRKFLYPKVIPEYETVEKIINDRVSVSRFGDGEMNWMLGEDRGSFEKPSNLLSKRLKEVISSNEKDHINCIPYLVDNMETRVRSSQIFWKTHIAKYAKNWAKYCSSPPYYDANFTRMYMGFEEKSPEVMEKKFAHIKKIWEKRNLLIVEGTNSRLGVGNDLFTSALSVNRILCPKKDAFDRYDEILTVISKYITPNDPNQLILLALGPTATVLAFDLSKKGVQAIDIGHVDIEYEWYLRGAEKKVNIAGKFTNEKGGFKENKLLDLTHYYQEVVEEL